MSTIYKLTIEDLNNIRSLAKDNFSHLAPHGLESEEFKVLCWVEAVRTQLQLDIHVIYPYDKIMETEEY